MPDIRYQEFYDEFENTKYPFDDTATLKDMDGALTIPVTLFLDASLYLPGTVGNIYISQIEITKSGTTITVAEEGSSITAQAIVEPGSQEDILYIKNDKGCVVGCLCSEYSRLSFFNAYTNGTYNFLPNATRFSSRCVFQDCKRGVSSIGGNGTTMHGKVWLIGGDGVYLRATGNEIRIDIAGDVLNAFAECDSLTGYTTDNYLRTINHQPPDMYGNIGIAQLFTGIPSAFRINSQQTGTTFKQL